MGCTQSQDHHFPSNVPRQEDDLQFLYPRYDIEEEFTYVYRSCARLAQKYMDRLPTVRLEHDASQLVPMDEDCMICFAPYCRGSTLVSLPCGHSYHKECLQEWFCRQCTCPYCRYEMGKASCKKRQLLVDVLRKRQDEMRHMQHRRTVLEQLSFTTGPSMAIGVA